MTPSTPRASGATSTPRASGATFTPRASGATFTPRASGATSTAPPASMEEIVALARSFAAAREATEALADDIRALQRKALSGRLRALRSRVAEQAAAKESLRAAIRARPDLFVRPRTVTVDGIRFGLRKQPGAVSLSATRRRRSAVCARTCPSGRRR